MEDVDMDPLHTDPLSQIARKAIAARHALGLTQADVAEQSGVSRPTVMNLELGRPLRVDTLLRMFDVLGLELRAVAPRYKADQHE